MNDFGFNSVFPLVITMVSVGVLPFLAIMVTSYIKLTVVLSLVRNALGIRQTPSNLVINGLAIVLSFYIMMPVVEEITFILRENPVQFESTESFFETADKLKEPVRSFLVQHAHPAEKRFFLLSARALWPRERADRLREQDLFVLVPSFTISELTEAFQIGFLIFLPFLAIDLVVANILLAMGMMMVAPSMISLPFKLLLFVLVNGWGRIIHGLVLTYAP